MKPRSSGVHRVLNTCVLLVHAALVNVPLDQALINWYKVITCYLPIALGFRAWGWITGAMREPGETVTLIGGFAMLAALVEGAAAGLVCLVMWRNELANLWRVVSKFRLQPRIGSG